MPAFPRSHHKKVAEPNFPRHGSVTRSFPIEKLSHMPDPASWQRGSQELAHPKAEAPGPVPGVSRKQHLPAVLEDVGIAWVALSSILGALPVAVSISCPSAERSFGDTAC